LFRQQEGKFGDAPVYAIVAHEVGHAAQARFRFDNEAGAAPPSHTVAEEQQADCLSGATLAKAEQDGYLTADPGDFEEIVNSFMALKEQDGGDHGNAADRLHAFEHGYNSGDVESCLYNRAVPPPGLFL
jgi:predicted metalloprotease